MDFEIEHLRKPADEISSLGMIVLLIFSLTNIFRPKVVTTMPQLFFEIKLFAVQNGLFVRKWYFHSRKTKFSKLRNLQLKLCPFISGIFAVHASNLLALFLHRFLTTLKCKFSFDSIVWNKWFITKFKYKDKWWIFSPRVWNKNVTYL